MHPFHQKSKRNIEAYTEGQNQKPVEIKFVASVIHSLLLVLSIIKVKSVFNMDFEVFII